MNATQLVAKNKALKKFRPIREILTHHLCDTGAALYQLS